MAKSIFEILDDLNTTTSVPGFGSEVAHTIPRNLFPTAEQFESEEKLLAWANENGYTHALLQKGIQKGLIEVRATFKSCKKDDTWSESYGQKNVDAMEWKITERPNQAASKKVDQARYNDCLGMFGILATTGKNLTEIKEMLLPQYGEDIVNNVFETLSKAA